MATIPANNINRRIQENKELIELIQRKDFGQKVEDLGISWEDGSINKSASLYELIKRSGLAIDDKLTTAGELFFSRISIDFESELIGKKIENKYKIESIVRSGKNSSTFLARHLALNRKIVIKLLRPGASSDTIKSLQLLSLLSDVKQLVQPLDYFEYDIKDVFGKNISIECIVFPYVEGTSLREFLNNEKRPLNAYAIASFIKQVSNVLSRLEDVGAYHGDLHEENIIVNTGGNTNLQFNIIDVSFGITGSLTSEICKDSDMAYFRQHVWNFLSAQQRFLGKMSLRKYLGSKIFHIISAVMDSNPKPSFKTINGLFSIDPAYAKYLESKRKFIEDKFVPPGSFKLQRYEEITDQTVALKLFEPDPELMESIKGFSNIVISGNRGSGKSTYLAAIAYFPSVEHPLVSQSEVFGIYFPCRQGEFRLLSSEMINYQEIGFQRVKHLMVVKIIRRTLEAINDGIEKEKLIVPGDYTELKKKISVLLGQDEIISLDENVVSEMRNLVSIIIRVEMKELDTLYKHEEKILSERIANESLLIDFFKTVRNTFMELSSTRFHILFDDAGEPNIPKEAQQVINDLIISSNPLYCIKLSTEKYSFDFLTTQNKQLESGHDYYSYDISSIFFMGRTGLKASKLENYFRQIIKRRLQYFDYKSEDIRDYIGNDEVKFIKLIDSLATGKRNAYYCGWPMVWRIADRTPRNLLEIVSEIFSVENIDRDTNPKLVSNRSQDRAIRAVSEKRLRSLSQISGVIDIHGTKVSLGKRLFEVTSAIGSVFRIYLRQEAGKKRKDQTLGIERNDSSTISEEASEILKALIKYGVLDESKLDFARDDRVKKPMYVLNLIYCPVFGIGLVRDQHLRLSKSKFEELFLLPKKFMTYGTKRLRDRDSSAGESYNLFEN